MWRSIERIDRLAKALTYREIDHRKIDIYDLEKTLKRRGITDAKLSDVCDVLLNYLEPKSCQMSHCESHGVDGFCCCCENLVPSKCKKHRDFLKRCKKRANKAADKLLEAIGDQAILIDYSWDSYYFFQIGEQEKFSFVNKWSYRLKSDVWDEMKRRRKNAENMQ